MDGDWTSGLLSAQKSPFDTTADAATPCRKLQNTALHLGTQYAGGLGWNNVTDGVAVWRRLAATCNIAMCGMAMTKMACAKS